MWTLALLLVIAVGVGVAWMAAGLTGAIVTAGVLLVGTWQIRATQSDDATAGGLATLALLLAAAAGMMILIGGGL